MMLSSAGRPGTLPGAARSASPVPQQAGQAVELLDAILTATGARLKPGQQPPLVTRHVLRERRHRLRILLAEDNVVNQRLAVRLLERQGHAVVVAGTGRAALEALEREHFDLVLMDLQMPDMDGLAALTAIRELEARASAGDVAAGGGLLVRRGRADSGHCRDGARHAGRQGALSRGRHGRLRHEADPAGGARVRHRALAPPGEPARGEASPRPPSISSPRDGSPAGMKSSAPRWPPLFMEGCRQYQAELRDAVQAGDPVRIGRIAHTLKGAAGTVGATTAQGLAAELEGLSQGGYDERVATLSGELEQELGRATEFLAAQIPARPS